MKQNVENIDWYALSLNEKAISLLEQYPLNINWYFLSRNPNAIPLLEQFPENVDIGSLCRNTNARTLIQKYLSGEISASETDGSPLDWGSLSSNPGAITILRNHQNKIKWESLFMNNKAIIETDTIRYQLLLKHLLHSIYNL